MTKDQINKRFAELVGLCWHEWTREPEVGLQAVCTCGALFDVTSYNRPDVLMHKYQNPDFCADPRLVLAVMMKQENFGEFLREIGGNGDDIEYAPCVPISLILDKTGQLALKAISWMEAQNPKAPLCDGCMYKNNSWYCDNYHNREKCTKYVLDSETQSGWRKTRMRKEHTVVITIGGDELCKLIDREARRQGLLKDVKSTVEYHLFDQGQEVSVEYEWEESC